MSSNSSIMTEEFVAGRKLVVHLAENGHTFEFNCDGSMPVAQIQRMVGSLSGVQCADQLLICGKYALDPQQQLAYYKLPQDDREVFVFNKARLVSDSRPPPEALDVPNAAAARSAPSLPDGPHPLDRATDPASKALASYEKQFWHHFHRANAFHVSTNAKFELCKRLLREIQVQEKALETARGNLDHTFKRLNQRYSEFMRHFGQQNRVHFELLENFERDVERLRSLRLHPLIQSVGRRCLLDLVKVDELRKWRESCLSSHRQFEDKVSHLKKRFGELAERVGSVLSGMYSADSKDLEFSIRDHERVVKDQEIIMQSLSKDVENVKKLVNDCVSRQLSASVRPHDAVSALGPMYDLHEKDHLPKAEKCDNLMANLLDKCKRKKDGMNLLVHVSMQKVKTVQHIIKDLVNQLHAFEEVMGHQEKEFENLKFVNGVGHAYRACLAEVIRRKSSLKLYMGLAGQLAERLATEREAEIRRREGFYKAWSKYIPQDILASMGLFDSPSQCDVNIAPFDTNLLQIDVADIDRYAPQPVVGLSLKGDKDKGPKSNLATSSDSFNLNKSEENAIDTLVNYESDVLLGVCDSVVAGTSKLEVENARLKSELASAIALICAFNAGIGYDPFDKDEPDDMVKAMKEKTVEALQSKDEYVKHLQSILNLKQKQCSSYEKRIQELEQRLENQYAQGQKLAAQDGSESVLSTFKADGYREGMFGDGETPMPCVSTVSMEEASSTSALDPKHDLFTGQTSKTGEGGDENMIDFSGMLNTHLIDSARNSMDASMQETMQETPRDIQEVDDSDNYPHGNGDKSLVGDANKEVKITTAGNSSDNKDRDALDMLPCEVASKPSLEAETRDSLVLDLQNALADKSNQFIETENKLKAAMEETMSLQKELEVSRTLLDESQLNCAHLENCLHEAREEARTNLCAADRRASEYSALRTTAVRMHSLFERFRSCVTAQVGVGNFADTLRSLALSLASSVSEDEDDGTAEFRLSIKILSDKVSLLSRHRSELLERCSRAEAALDEKTDQIKSLYTKLQLEKQASKEKVSFVRLEVHELACFVLNSDGHYEAIHRNCSNYYLSAESVALFTEQCSGRRPPYIIGQIVHIERRIVRPPATPRTALDAKMDGMNPEGRSSRLPPVTNDTSNPYGLPAGCEYFIVTVAMLPDTIRSPPS